MLLKALELAWWELCFLSLNRYLLHRSHSAGYFVWFSSSVYYVFSITVLVNTAMNIFLFLAFSLSYLLRVVAGIIKGSS